MDVQEPDGAAAIDETWRRKRETKQLDAVRPLGAWERYRALNDATDEAYEILDLTNREARFALILMGGLNAGLVVFATRAEVVARLAPSQRLITGVLLAGYVGLAFWFLLQAIQALRPGHFRPQSSGGLSKGIRYFEDVVTRDVDAHIAAWNDRSVSQLNAEMAAQFHSLCLKNVERKRALRRLYQNLRLMTVMLALILLLVALFTQI